MAKREPKTRQTTTVEVVGRPGDLKGRMEFGAGSVVYYRRFARRPTLDLTYQQLLALFEREVEYRAIDAKAFKLPRAHPVGDFVLGVNEVEMEESVLPVVNSVCKISKLDPRRIDLGSYQFSQDMQSGRMPKRYRWFAQLSIQAALWVVSRYVDKFLVSKRSSEYTDEDVQISKREMRAILLGLCKRIG